MANQFYAVAIDGPAGAGKSTLARAAARELEFVYVDTGAIYRTVGLAILTEKVDYRNQAALTALLGQLRLRLLWTDDGAQHMLLFDRDVSAQIRQPEVSVLASLVSAIPAVRQFLLDTQREIARTHNVIMDGRDIGTVVLPQADVKIYLSASPETRARRRYLELQARGEEESYEAVLSEMIARDERDMHREIAPLRPAEDAILLDTSDLDLEQSLAAILKIIREKLGL